MRIVVMAKAPVAGRVKTRLSPPLTMQQAAELAEAALVDTLEAALACGADGVVLALDGQPGPWLPPGVEVIAQRGDELDERLAGAWADVAAPAIQIGMDTPQVTPELLAAAGQRLERSRSGAVLGLATDGGWWALGLREVRPDAVLGVPTSRLDTGHRQLVRLTALGLAPDLLPVLRDVDEIDDAIAVAAVAPATRFARCLRAVHERAA
jgi:glycosyltransferase A (GT-A) superfamily protein (DUF2064 family)